jgi:hypothetical protein
MKRKDIEQALNDLRMDVDTLYMIEKRRAAQELRVKAQHPERMTRDEHYRYFGWY